MKKFLAFALVLGLSSVATAGIVMDIDVNSQDWDGQSPVVPSDWITVTLSHDTPVNAGLLNTVLGVSNGEQVDASIPGPADAAALGWLTAGGRTVDAPEGFNVEFNATVLFPRNPGNIYEFTFHVPDGAGSRYVIIDATGGQWNGVAADAGGADGLPYAMIHIVPEPMTLSLLGLGGLGLLRRRRA